MVINKTPYLFSTAFMAFHGVLLSLFVYCNYE